MKVKLLKKLRRRFKWKYLGEIERVIRMPFRKYWEIIDSQATEIRRMEDVSRYCFGDMIRIDSPTIAERLSMELKGIMFVYHHREYRAKMKNKSFKKKHFGK